MREESNAADWAGQYSQGIKDYRRGLYESCLDRLGPLSNRGDLVGRVARFYCAQAHRQIGLSALCQGLCEHAETHLRAAMSLVGRQNDLSCYLVGIYARTGRFARCADELERAGDAEPSRVDLRRMQALAQWRGGQRAQALMTLLAAIRQYGPTGELLHLLGSFHAAEERYDDAHGALSHSVELDGANADAHYRLGLVCCAKGDMPGAVRSLQRAYELRSDDLLLAWQLAKVAAACKSRGQPVTVRLGDPPAPSAGGSRVSQLAQYVTGDPDFVDAFLALPPSEADGELLELLAGVLKVALNEHPKYADLHHRASNVMERLGRTPEALDHAKRAVAINGSYVQALAHLGRLHAKVGHDDQALASLEAAVSAGADWADVHCLAGEVLIRAGETAQARRHLERALQLNGRYTRAAQAMSSLAA